MLILGDESKSNGRLPWVTFSLVAINIIVYSAQCFLGPEFTRGFSLIPKEIVTLTDLTRPESVRAKVPTRIWYEQGRRRTQYREVIVTVPQAPGPFPIVLTLATSMFMHGGLLHLLGNMWFLVVFGRNVECALNHGRFLVFYVACGVLGGLVYTASNPWSVIPCLGASGAISGLMGAYVAIHPLNLISIWFGFFIGVIKLPACAVVGVWFLFQYLAAFQSLEFAGTNLGGTAYWDHVGGFLAGIGTIRGMVIYLKWRHATKPSAEEEELASGTDDSDLHKPADPFRASLPASTEVETTASAPSQAKVADPFRACLPENSSRG